MSIFTADNGTQNKTFPKTIAVAAQSGLTFSADLPDGNVGTAYVGSVTITRQPNCTGDVNIALDAGSSLPAGLSLSATVDNGDGTYTAPVTGTPSAGGTTTTTFTATDGVQTATSLEHEFVVQAASASAPDIVNKAKAIGTGDKSVTISFVDPTTSEAWTPTAGNMLTALVATNGTATLNTPAGWTLVDSRFLNAGGVAAFRRLSDGTETSVKFTGSANALSGVVLEIDGQGSTPINAHAVAAGGTQSSDLPTLTPTVGKCLAIGAAVWQQPGTSATYSVTSGWTIEASTSPAFFGICVVSQTLDDSLSAVTGTIQINPNGNQSSTLLMLIQP